MIASQAANFLATTNGMPELRADFASTYTHLTEKHIPMPPIGNVFVFSDNSVLFAFTNENTAGLLTSSIEEAPATMVAWGIEHNRLEEVIEAISIFMETTNEAQ